MEKGNIVLLLYLCKDMVILKIERYNECIGCVVILLGNI